MVKYVKHGLNFLFTTAATRVMLLGTKPRVLPKRKNFKPGPLKKKCCYPLFTLIVKELPKVVAG